MWLLTQSALGRRHHEVGQRHSLISCEAELLFLRIVQAGINLIDQGIRDLMVWIVREAQESTCQFYVAELGDGSWRVRYSRASTGLTRARRALDDMATSPFNARLWGRLTKAPLYI